MSPLRRPCVRCGRPGTLTGKCDACQRDVQRKRDAERGTAAERGYDADWRKVRAQILERDRRICHWCGAPANTVDHVIPLTAAPALRLDPSNLVAACLSCNSRRVRRHRKGQS